MLPLEKLGALARRYRELDDLLCSPGVLADHQRLQKLNRERSEIEPVILAFRASQDIDRRLR